MDWQTKFLESCCDLTNGTALSEGAFTPGLALWVGRREIAHFDDERTLDVRLTKAVIRSRRDELTADERAQSVEAARIGSISLSATKATPTGRDKSYSTLSQRTCRLRRRVCRPPVQNSNNAVASTDLDRTGGR